MEYIGILAALASAASWGFGTVMFDRLGKVVPYAGITFLKGAMSIVLIALLAIWHGGLVDIALTDFLYLALSGIIGIAIGDTLFFKSLQDLGAKVQVLYFMLGQVVTMLLSFLFLGDILSIQEYAGAAVLLIGIMIVTWGKQEDHPNKQRGILLGLLSILCFSVSSIMVKVAIGDIDVISATFYRMIFGTASVLFVGVGAGKIKSWIAPLHEAKTALLFILNVIVITIGGFMLSMLAIKEISVSLASILSTTEPVFVLVLAYFINHERPTKREILGAAIVVVGLLIIVNYG